MTLNEWFDAEEKRTGKRPKKAAFGRKLGITGAGVQKILDGSIPRPENIALIEKATSGRVRLADFYPKP